MELYQLIFAFSAAASAISGSILLLGVVALIIQRAFLTDVTTAKDFSRSFK